MAHVPKREPCVKCKNQVFLAERLLINQSLYHRTCFRCARCNSILTLGNFYETEKDHEYCCEICPDEEKTTPKVDESNQLSIAQKIALFEKESSNVLKKSLSDEEKSKSLNRQPSVSSEVRNSFLATQIKTQKPVLIGDEDYEKTSNSESEEEEAPPSIHPNDVVIPSISNEKVFISDHKVVSKETPVNFVVTKELTSDKDSLAIADVSEMHYESQEKNDNAQIVIDDFDKIVSQNDIDLEFERLAEEAFNNPTVSISSRNIEEKSSIPAISTRLQEELEKPEVIPSNTLTPQTPATDSVVLTNEIENIVQDQTEQDVNVSHVPSKIAEVIVYPDDLNPFGDEEEEDSKPSVLESTRLESLNPFGSCSEDEEKDQNVNSIHFGTLTKPPRPPLPKTMTTKAASTNPFGSDEDDDDNQKPSASIRTPVPTPRKPLLHSLTPEPTPRSIPSHNSPGHSFKGSTSSLSSSTDGTSLKRRKKKAPAPPPPTSIPVDETNQAKQQFVTPKKKRPAPTPPIFTPKPSAQEFSPSLCITATDFPSTDDLISVTEANDSLGSILDSSAEVSLTSQPSRRLIPLEECLVEEGSNSINPEMEEIAYRRKIVPLVTESVVEESFEHFERSKDDKEAQNRQRQSLASSLSNMRSESDSIDSLPYLNKSSHGKWKRRKGPAPALPGYAQPQRRILQMLPLQDIRQELEVIEVQQQGLEKQGVMLEKMIRERCEGSGDNRSTEELLEALPSTKNPKEVEELILQLFELVNEKNELFRRQAELMYLKRAHRLEEEQADVEYEIRTLMAQPEQNKTDSDKAKEEALIARLVEIVQLRNEVVDGLDRDRLREAEEDLSIKQRMESHTAKLDQDYLNQTPTKLSKKEKKKLKEAKKLKNKKLDADKDLDTSEIKPETSEKKKKKKKFLF